MPVSNRKYTKFSKPIYAFYKASSILNFSDPRTNDLPLIGSPIIIPSILFLYLYVVLKYGPEFMETRKPYNLKTFVRYYNVFQIVVNAFVVQQFISAGWFTEITVYCELPDYSYNPSSLKVSFHFLFYQ